MLYIRRLLHPCILVRLSNQTVSNHRHCQTARTCVWPFRSETWHGQRHWTRNLGCLLPRERWLRDRRPRSWTRWLYNWTLFHLHFKGDSDIGLKFPVYWYKENTLTIYAKCYWRLTSFTVWECCYLHATMLAKQVSLLVVSVHLCVCLCVCAKNWKTTYQKIVSVSIRFGELYKWNFGDIWPWYLTLISDLDLWPWYLTLIFDLDLWPWSLTLIFDHSLWLMAVLRVSGSVMTEWLLHCRCAWSEDGRSEVWHRRHVCWHWRKSLGIYICARSRW